MIIACITDRRFAHLCGTMLASLDEQGDVGDCRVVVFSVGLRNRDKHDLRLSFGRSAARLSFIDIDPNTPPLKQLLPTRWTLGPANYARLFIPTILKGEDDRVLYLDCDIIVAGSLKPLQAIDFGGNIAAAAPESDQGLHPSLDSRADLPPDIPYFNAGVMLIDIERWNRENFTDKVFEFILRHQEKLRFPTQDPLNCVIRGRFVRLGREWNFIFRRSADSDCEGAKVIHFAGSKPWSSDHDHPARALFDRYRAMTPWRESRLESRFERRMRKIFGKRIIRLKRLWMRLTAQTAQ